MIEPQIVDHPTVFPMMCSCGNQHGPLIDTFREKHGSREYVCLRCAKLYARLFGFASGEVLDIASEAAATKAQLEERVGELEGLLKAERDDSELKDRAIEGLKIERDNLSNRVDHLETLRQRTAAEALA